MLSTKRIISLISISRPPPLFLWRSSRTAAHFGVFSGVCLVGQLGFLDSGNVDFVVVEECQQLFGFADDSIGVPLRQSKAVSGCWCRDRSRVHFDIASALRQKSEQQCRHQPLRNNKGDLTSRTVGRFVDLRAFNDTERLVLFAVVSTRTSKNQALAVLPQTTQLNN